jgi:hypothetical protein
MKFLIMQVSPTQYPLKQDYCELMYLQISMGVLLHIAGLSRLCTIRVEKCRADRLFDSNTRITSSSVINTLQRPVVLSLSIQI